MLIFSSFPNHSSSGVQNTTDLLKYNSLSSHLLTGLQPKFSCLFQCLRSMKSSFSCQDVPFLIHTFFLIFFLSICILEYKSELKISEYLFRYNSEVHSRKTTNEIITTFPAFLIVWYLEGFIALVDFFVFILSITA